MADPSSHPDFDLDVALSADLDGELDAYAAELGTDPAGLRAVLDDPAATARRAELAAVRHAVGDVPDDATASDRLDAVTRRRLLAGAGVGSRPEATRPARDRSWMLRAGAAAAVTLVLLGSLYALTRNSGDSGAKANGGAAASGGGAPAAVTGDLGDIGTINAAAVGRLLRGQTPAPAKRQAGASSDQAFSNGESGSPSGAAASTTTVAPVVASAVAGCANQYGTEGSIRFRASGAYQGRPAVVLGIDTATRTIVFVVAADNCTEVLFSLSR